MKKKSKKNKMKNNVKKSKGKKAKSTKPLTKLAKPIKHLTKPEKIPINTGAMIFEGGSSLKNKTGAWRSSRPVIDKKRCISCGICLKFCPEGCIKYDKHKKADVNYDYCKGDGICARECPVKCIKMEKEEK